MNLIYYIPWNEQPIFNITIHRWFILIVICRLISRSERDLLSVAHDGPDDMHTVARHGVKRGQRASLPRGFGSTECIHTSDQSLEMPDRVIKVYKADQTCKYFMVYKVRAKIEPCINKRLCTVSKNIKHIFISVALTQYVVALLDTSSEADNPLNLSALNRYHTGNSLTDLRVLFCNATWVNLVSHQGNFSLVSLDEKSHIG